MAKKSIIERERKKNFLVNKYSSKRFQLLKKYKNTTNIRDKFAIHTKLQKLPRNSSKVRLHNRCWKTGRSRGYIRTFGLSRHVFREMTHQGLLPGVIKLSW
uniref:Small ribosomal subunit protein uS14c n=1 Tax=Nitzschia alba TaxID=2858 RepID=A0A5C0F439_NITAL|nr:30S ribosomal protein S14 [Nitzschia alba]QEI59578.1 30S ribosomal protein S14 [Nitzschia alba]